MVRTFTLAKDSAEPEQNEDALVWGSGCLALADGASSDAASGLWAQELCRVFVEHGALERDLAYAHWDAQVRARPLPWFLAEKLRKPTHASFLGLTWSDQQLQLQAIGDSCAFVVRDNTLDLAFPYTRAEDLSGHPLLVPTQGALPPLQTQSIVLTPGDTVLAMTDALAAWLLTEQAHQPWRSLLALQNAGDFSRFISSLREAQRIVRDDTTLAIISPLALPGPDTTES
jgi:hypothetical protein